MTSPAGWYDDPGGERDRRRYWDGARWTDWVADDAGTVDRVAAATGPIAFRAGWPLRVVWWSGLAVVGASALAGVVHGAVTEIRGEESELLLTVVGFLASFASASVLAVLVSRRFGTGSVRSDVGIAWSPRELLAGLGTAVAAVVAAVLAGSAAAALFGADLDEGVDQFGSLDDELLGALVIAFAATLLAPVFEEVMYRGVLLPALLPRVGSATAVVLSAAAFSALHVDPRNDLATNGVVVAVTLSYGVVFGWQAVRSGGITRTIVAHALVNGYVSAFTLSGVV